MSDKMIVSTDLSGNTYDVPVSELQWRPAAYAIIIRHGEVLLVKAKGAYHLPGGGIDLGEVPEDAILREILEETGLIVANPTLVDLLTTFFAYDAYGSQKVRHVQSLLLYYACELVSGDFSDSKPEEYEVAIGATPEWVRMQELDNIVVGTSVDWRSLVKRCSGNISA